MIMALGAVVSGYLGFRRYEIWVPTAISCVIVAIQFAMFQVGNNPDVRVELYVFSFMLSLFVCYATYGIGRAIAQRFKSKR
jgi:MFS superfamily sulfate permease-like transporter